MKYLLAAVALSTQFAQVQANDSIPYTQELGTKYLLTLNDVTLKEGESVTVHAVRTSSEKKYGVDIVFYKDSVVAVSGTTHTLLSCFLPNSEGSHTYSVGRFLKVKVFRDGVELGDVADKLLDEASVLSVVTDGVSLSSEMQVQDNADEVSMPSETDYENHLDNILPYGWKNLSTDAYCNKGFASDSPLTENRPYNMSAVWNAEGNVSLNANEAWSGGNCLQIAGEGQAKMSVKLTSGKRYLVRAMVKSTGFYGGIGFNGEQDFLTVTPTEGQWVQLEGVLLVNSSNVQAINVFSNNQKNDEASVLLLDNVEVYEQSVLTNAGGNLSVISLAANQKWAPTKPTTVYSLGVTEYDGKYTQVIDTCITVQNSLFFTKKVAGSVMYPMSFPGKLRTITVSGNTDLGSNLRLENGVDYLLQRYNYPSFEYLDSDTEVSAGCYMVQFLDNLDGMNVTFYFEKTEEAAATTAAYAMLGNRTFTAMVPEGKYYKYNTEKQVFYPATDETILPFEAYIATTETQPHAKIVPNGSTKVIALQADGKAVSVATSVQGITLSASKPCLVNVYNLAGVCVKMVSLKCGSEFIALPEGIYLIEGQKVKVGK